MCGSAAMGWIYKLTSPSGRAYIGKTCQNRIDIRLKQHCSRTSKCWAIAAAIQKYGLASFVVEKWQFPDEYLDEYEQLFILDHGTLAPDGYNLKSAGYENKLTREGKAKQSVSSKARWQDAQYRQETCESLREASARRWADPEQRKAARAAAKKRMQDHPELREALAEKAKALWQDRGEALATAIREGHKTEEARARASQSAQRKFQERPELKEKISGAVKELWQDPEYRARQCRAMTG